MQPAAAATNPAAGWFADPHAPNFLRWWDGIQWTQHVHPVAPAQLAQHAAPAVHQPGAGQHAAHQVGVAHQGGAAHGHYVPASAQQAHAQPATHGVPGIYTGPATQAVAQPGAALGAAAGTSPAVTGEESLFQANPKSFLAMIVSAIYLALAVSTGIVLIGIVPAFAAFHAMERREKLAPLAVLAAVVAVGFAFTHVQRV